MGVRLQPVLCRYVKGDPVPSDPAVAEARWVDDRTLSGMDMPAANQVIVSALLSQG